MARLRGAARQGAAIALRCSGLPWLVRKALGRNRACVVIYHAPAPDVLDRHLAYLARRFNFLPFGDLVDAIHARDWSAIPPRALVVTLDDGHRSNADLLPVFRKYGVRPTIYLCSQVAGTLRHFWFRESAGEWDRYKALPQAERLRKLEAATGFQPIRDYPADSRQALSTDEIRAMRPWVDFQSHSRFHPILTTCTDSECWEEVERSREEVKELVGRRCEHFSYPNGDYLERELDYVRKAGYRSARSIDLGWNDVNTDPYRLRVQGIADDASISMLSVQLSGVPNYLWRLTRGCWDGRWPTTTLHGGDPSRATTRRSPAC